MPQPATGARTSAGLVACCVLAACASPAGTDAPSGAAVDWSSTTYTLTCDGIVPGGLRATVVDGYARVPADEGRPPYYAHYDVRVADTATGDLDGDDELDAVVLLECSPQPSNGIVQEVQLLSPTGELRGTLPSPRDLQGTAPLPPEYRPAGLSIRNGEIVAAMTAYGPDDVHASGPSVPLTVRWRYDGRDFVRVTS
ncbi:hypothetical protein [Blastococcus sp. TF02A-30]|uniref:hypothetical protein n=1 Tax=Blastococcus sp. TF02A-30 TaxID=2250580 RepID=UPI001314A31D|nr:hypothetical protein [Blastococcus sp. TF02A-30]